MGSSASRDAGKSAAVVLSWIFCRRRSLAAPFVISSSHGTKIRAPRLGIPIGSVGHGQPDQAVVPVDAGARLCETPNRRPSSALSSQPSQVALQGNEVHGFPGTDTTWARRHPSLSHAAWCRFRPSSISHSSIGT